MPLGKRKPQLPDLEPGERSGSWQVEVAEKGMMTEEVFLKVDTRRKWTII